MESEVNRQKGARNLQTSTESKRLVWTWSDTNVTNVTNWNNRGHTYPDLECTDKTPQSASFSHLVLSLPKDKAETEPNRQKFNFFLMGKSDIKG